MPLGAQLGLGGVVAVLAVHVGLVADVLAAAVLADDVGIQLIAVRRAVSVDRHRGVLLGDGGVDVNRVLRVVAEHEVLVAGVGHGRIQAGLDIGDGHGVVRALDNVHARQQHRAVERGAGLTHAAAVAVLGGVARVFGRELPAARLGAGADDGVEVHRVARVHGKAVEVAQRLGDVGARGGAAERGVRGVFHDHIEAALGRVRADAGLDGQQRQRGVSAAGLHQLHDQRLCGLQIQLLSQAGFAGEVGLVRGDHHRGVHGLHVQRVVDGLQEGVDQLRVVLQLRVEFHAALLQAVDVLLAVEEGTHMADVPGALDVGIGVDAGVEVRRGEAPALIPCGEGILGVDARVQRIVHGLHALLQGEIVQQNAVYADVRAEGIAVCRDGEVDPAEIDRSDDETDEHKKRDKAQGGPSPAICAACVCAPRGRIVAACSARGAAPLLCPAVRIRSALFRRPVRIVGTSACLGGSAGAAAGCGATCGRTGPAGRGRSSAAGTCTGVGFAFHHAFAPQLIYQYYNTARGIDKAYFVLYD